VKGVSLSPSLTNAERAKPGNGGQAATDLPRLRITHTAYIRPVLDTRLIGAIGKMDMQGLYAQMLEPSLSARTNLQNREDPLELSRSLHANPIVERDEQLCRLLISTTRCRVSPYDGNAGTKVSSRRENALQPA
jgi:hypothetical protein